MPMPPEERERLHWAVNAMFTVMIGMLGFLGKALYEKIERLDSRIDQFPQVFVTVDQHRLDNANILMEIKSLEAAIKHNSEFLQADYNRRMDKIETILTDMSTK